MATPYYQQDGITIYCGDSREILPTLSHSLDLICTDPPYGISHPTKYKSNGRGNLASCTDYAPVHGDDEPFDPRWLLSFGGAHIFWGGNYYAHLLTPQSGWLVWDKERPDDLDQATCELAWTDCVKGARRFKYLWNGMIRAGDESLYHPTQKPVALMKWCLSLRWTKVFKSVIDPYMGAGATLVAAKNMGIQCIGIEINEEYCRIAVERLRQGALFGAGVG